MNIALPSAQKALNFSNDERQWIVTGQWLVRPSLAREKEYTRLGDEIARERRDLPWVRVENEYRFNTNAARGL